MFYLCCCLFHIFFVLFVLVVVILPVFAFVEAFFEAFFEETLVSLWDTRVSSLFVQKWCYLCLERDFSKHLFGRTCFGLNDIQIFHIHNKLRGPLLYQLFTKAVQISTFVQPNQMKLGFVITHNKASYVAEEDSL